MTETVLMSDRSPKEKPVPPPAHLRYAGYHWLRRYDFDGHACGYEVYQWQPQAELWCRIGEYASYRDLDLIGYKYIGPCPQPLHPEDDEVIQLKKMLTKIKDRLNQGSYELPQAPITRGEFDLLERHFFLRLP